MSFELFSQNVLPEFEERLKRQIKKDSETNLEESMLYSLMAPGKRLRPVILLATVSALNSSSLEFAYPAAIALEMIHTYSLIHDDLPAMDDDDLRRGLPTNHIQFDEATAILAGDALLTLAFEVIAEPVDHLAPAVQLKLVKDLAQVAGYQGMIAGQKRDIEGEGQSLLLDDVVVTHRLKTGALFAFALRSGARIAGADKNTTEKLGQWGERLGLAFQIRDDILDIVASEEDLGKGVLTDQGHNKATYPALLGLQGAYEKLNQELATCQRILQELSNGDNDFSVLIALVDHLAIDQYFK